MAGVEVGRVQSIQLTNNRVLVAMKLHPSAEVKTDSIATIKFTGLLGQNFVSIDFGTPRGEPLKNDQFVSTAEQADLSAMMQKIDNVASGVENLTKSFTGFRIDTLVGPLREFITANKDPLTATISNMQAVSLELSSQVSQGKGTLGKLIKDEALYNSALSTISNLQDTAIEIKATVADARKIVDQVNAGQGTVGKLLHDDKLYRETTEAMTNAKEILQKVNQGQGTVGKLVNDQEFYRNAKLTLQKLDQATEGLEDQGPLSVLGLAVSKLF
jgi:phospholipid/cholesterol/gamma-HCH transport system substrate-binding protein